jgi:uncharacterized protein (DUF2062 family)
LGEFTPSDHASKMKPMDVLQVIGAIVGAVTAVVAVTLFAMWLGPELVSRVECRRARRARRRRSVAVKT